jgi:hypothetical protein
VRRKNFLCISVSKPVALLYKRLQKAFDSKHLRLLYSIYILYTHTPPGFSIIEIGRQCKGRWGNPRVFLLQRKILFASACIVRRTIYNSGRWLRSVQWVPCHTSDRRHRTVTRYPWNRWFARRRPFSLSKGKHFRCEPYVMAQQIRNEAQRRNASVSIQIKGKELRVTNKE